MRSSPGPDNPADGVRLDLYLKRSRLIKRRTLAAAACENGYVLLNDRQAPPGKQVRVGDRLEIRYPNRRTVVEVTGLPAGSARGQDCYRIIRSERVTEELV